MPTPSSQSRAARLKMGKTLWVQAARSQWGQERRRSSHPSRGICDLPCPEKTGRCDGLEAGLAAGGGKLGPRQQLQLPRPAGELAVGGCAVAAEQGTVLVAGVAGQLD